MQTIPEGCEVGMFLLILGHLPTCVCDTDAQKPTWKIRLKVEDPSSFTMREWGQPCEVGQHSLLFPDHQCLSLSQVKWSLILSLPAQGNSPGAVIMDHSGYPGPPGPNMPDGSQAALIREGQRQHILSVHGHRNGFHEEPTSLEDARLDSHLISPKS